MMKRFGLLTVLVSVCWLTGCGQAVSYSGDFRHLVLFKFKDDAPPADVKAIEDQIMAMKSQIPTIKTMEWRKDCSVENLQHGFTHAFLVTFENPDGLKVYSPHAAHQAALDTVGFQ